MIFSHNYLLDDTTVSEILDRDEDSRMQSSLDKLIAWSDSNYMKINSKKTKEMILGPCASINLPAADLDL